MKFNKKKLFYKFRGTSKANEHATRDINFINKLRDSYRHPYLKRKPVIFNYTTINLTERMDIDTPADETYQAATILIEQREST